MANEQQTNAQETPKDAASNTQEGNIIATASVLDRADTLRKGLEETEKRIQEQMDRFENITARTMLGGVTEAGQAKRSPEEIAKEQIDKEVAAIAKKFR